MTLLASEWTEYLMKAAAVATFMWIGLNIGLL